MKAFTLALICITVFGASLLCTSRAGDVPIITAEPAPELNRLFATQSGWLGADGAYSTTLGPNRVVWVFGDTFVGSVKNGRRVDCTMVNNTIAIQTGPIKDAKIEFLTGKPKDAKPTSFFLPADGSGWFWPMAVSRVGEHLYIFLTQIDKAEHGAGVFGFKAIGLSLATVENPDDAPGDWRITQAKIPFSDFTPGNERTWGLATFIDGANIYIYGLEEKGNAIDRKKMLVARAPAAQLADFKTWRFRAETGWSEAATDASPLAAGMANEYSVSIVPGTKKLITVYSENGLSDCIMARFADAPDGPWSEPTLLYTAPDTKADKGVFCYSAKAHPEAADGNELIVTYCQNAFEFSKVFESPDLYRPKFVRVKVGTPR